MSRVVLDTNSLLVSIGRKSPYRPVFDALLSSQYELLVSNDIISEYAEIIERKANAKWETVRQMKQPGEPTAGAEKQRTTDSWSGWVTGGERVAIRSKKPWDRNQRRNTFVLSTEQA